MDKRQLQKTKHVILDPGKRDHASIGYDFIVIKRQHSTIPETITRTTAKNN